MVVVQLVDNNLRGALSGAQHQPEGHKSDSNKRKIGRSETGGRKQLGEANKNTHPHHLLFSSTTGVSVY
jgi:hypothetical protein